MDKSEFAKLFHESSLACVAFARTYVMDHLPESTIYRLFPNASYDGNPLRQDECVFPEDGLPDDEFHTMDADHVIDFLWRDGMVPEWVDLYVVSATPQHTVVEVLCCGRFTANRDLLYYNCAHRGPFGIKSPPLPPGYESKDPKIFALFDPREGRQNH